VIHYRAFRAQSVCFLQEHNAPGTLRLHWLQVWWNCAELIHPESLAFLDVFDIEVKVAIETPRRSEAVAVPPKAVQKNDQRDKFHSQRTNLPQTL